MMKFEHITAIRGELYEITDEAFGHTDAISMLRLSGNWYVNSPSGWIPVPDAENEMIERLHVETAIGVLH